MKTVHLLIGLLVGSISFGQAVETRLANAIKGLEADEQFKHAILSMYVVDSKTGKVIYDKNSQIGLAPASCQKVVTSVAAFELLGNAFKYKTELVYGGIIRDTVLNGNLGIIVSGDPTLGSWRWMETGEDIFKQKVIAALQANNIKIIRGDMIIDDSKWESQSTPRGWIWEDVGNYYGAGARGLNWHENQYDLILRPGKKEGDSVEIIQSTPELQIQVLVNELRAGKEGTGDNSVIYLPEEGLIGFIRGTVPAGKDHFTVSGSMPNAAYVFLRSFEDALRVNKIEITGRSKISAFIFMNKEKMPALPNKLLTIYSPPLDSINYWFLKRSINLYGEALVKTIAYEKRGFGSTDTGIAIIKDFWSQRGIEGPALNILDGSGLSPANRVTTNALVTVMQYARQQNWFPSFYDALPQANGLKMKDGYINGVRSFTGYVKRKDGSEYTFSFIVNNFNGSAGTVRENVEAAGHFKVTSVIQRSCTKTIFMPEQNFKNHARFVPLYHYVAPTAILALLIGSGINAFDACHKGDGLYSATLICLICVVLAIVWLYARVFALKAQDRAIRAEENLRHFAIAGSLLDSRLTMAQIIALRFASNNEFVTLAHRAAEENMKPVDIKKAIQNWRADNDRA